MHRLLSLAIAVLVAVPACRPMMNPPLPATAPTPGGSPAPTSPSAAADLRTAMRPVAPPRFQTTNACGVRLHLVAFDSRSHRLAVVDQGAGPGSRWPDAKAAGHAHRSLATINGGFFTPAGEPLGLLISDGQRRGRLNPSSVGAAVWYSDPVSGTAIVRRETWLGSGPPSPSSLLQAGPLLVENGKTITGLEADRSRPRSFLAWDGGNCWCFAVTSPCTLAELASALSNSRPAGWQIRHAMNLDGGRSSELWVAPETSGGPFQHRPFWNTPVRNFLALHPASH